LPQFLFHLLILKIQFLQALLLHQLKWQFAL